MSLWRSLPWSVWRSGHLSIGTSRSANQAQRAGRVITCIEFLSPWNKSGPGRREYLKKQKALFESRFNSVEIDLVRAGRRTF
jgi:hypothetical protein